MGVPEPGPLAGPLAGAQAGPTIRDVALLARVSTATVSKVLNDRPGVAAGTRARVRGAIARLDFTPSIAAQRLRAAARGAPDVPVVGVVARVLDDRAGEVLKGVSSVAGDVALEVVVVVGGGAQPPAAGDWERRVLAGLRGSVDGALVLDACVGPLVRDLPVVVVGTREGADPVAAGRRAVLALLRQVGAPGVPAVPAAGAPAACRCTQVLA